MVINKDKLLLTAFYFQFIMFKWQICYTSTLSGSMIALCTASLTFNNTAFCPHSLFMCFVWISVQRGIISLNNINTTFFVMDADCVLSEAENNILYTI